MYEIESVPFKARSHTEIAKVISLKMGAQHLHRTVHIVNRNRKNGFVTHSLVMTCEIASAIAISVSERALLAISGRKASSLFQKSCIELIVELTGAYRPVSVYIDKLPVKPSNNFMGSIFQNMCVTLKTEQDFTGFFFFFFF